MESDQDSRPSLVHINHLAEKCQGFFRGWCHFVALARICGFFRFQFSLSVSSENTSFEILGALIRTVMGNLIKL